MCSQNRGTEIGVRARFPGSTAVFPRFSMAARPEPEFIALRQLAALTPPSHRKRGQDPFSGNGVGYVPGTFSAKRVLTPFSASSCWPSQEPARPEGEHERQDHEGKHHAVSRRVGEPVGL